MKLLKHARTDVLDIAYLEDGPKDGPVAVLLHGYPYDVTSFVTVAPLLADRGYRVVVPYLRGHGPTRFLDDRTARSGQQAALGADLMGLLDALEIPEAVLAGYDWGGRAACVVAAVQPERVAGLVTVNGYLIQDVDASARPIQPDLEAGFWYFYYFLTERGRAGLTANRREIAEVIWRRNSLSLDVDQTALDRVATSFANPDYVDVVIHSYRHRLGAAPGAPEYDEIERFLAGRPAITVPTVVLAGMADGNFPVSDAAPDLDRFTGPRLYRRVPRAGHDLPSDAPDAFVEAVLNVTALAKTRDEVWDDARLIP
jgi:pimeloyl-ACP methyl ester carboxylesterase